MKAVQFSSFGDSKDVLEVVEVDEPGTPSAGHVRLQVEYSPVNLHDLFFIAGFLGKPELPAIPGNEGVARVVEVGADVDNVVVGDRVILPLLSGAWREQLVIPAEGLFALPEADVEQLSMLGSNSPAAGLILSEYADVKPGDWIVQSSANGGVGLNLIAIAKLRGLKTINFVRRPEAVDEVKQAGGDIVLVDHPGAAAEIRAQIGAEARIPVAADSVGGSVAQTMIELLDEGGAFVFYGNASGEAVDPESEAIKSKNITVSGIFVGAFDNLSKIVPVVKEVAPLVASGGLTVPVEAVYPLESVHDAIAHVQRGGKILLRIARD